MVVFVIFAITINQIADFVLCTNTLNGRYTESIENFKLLVPYKLDAGGEFHTYHLPHHYEHRFGGRTKRNPTDSIHYAIHLNGNEKYHVELWPNDDFMSPNLVFERNGGGAADRVLRNLDKRHLCHYTGRIRDHERSKVALSTCDGLAGYITSNSKRYFIEPVQDHEANEFGQHLHVIYEKEANSNRNASEPRSYCGTDDKWEDVWRKRLKDEVLLKNKEPTEHVIEKRGLTSVHRYLETLIVCDKKFLEYHKNSDYEQYVLTVMNMVADYYHDSSSGNQMDVVVVRVMYLDKEEEEIDLEIGQDATKTLASFCKWQEKINPKDIHNPNHHDIAVLLTRYDICSDNMSNCGLMGLAYVASACTHNEPCAINEDGGLVLGIVVAHEMGHVMGCAHDKEEESPCPAQDKDESYFVMAPYVHLYTTRWSTCSKAFITALFENNLGECLNDEPEISLYQMKNTLPGSVYDADSQCNMNFPNSTVCIINDENFCEMLLCKTSPTTCMSKEEPPADGTKCGENKWCFRKECVEIGERPDAINGGWGDWGEWTACSRTCGGGVSLASRDCNNPTPQHRGRYCIGERKKIKTCNLDPCPEGSPSFRDVQCAQHDNKTFADKLYHWKGYFLKEEPCVLYCINGEHTYMKMEPRAKDGTKCRPGTRDMCVSGTCKPLGCDGVIDSQAVEDVCGVCNGDGTQCKLVDEVYTDVGASGLKKIATIPAGSRKIRYEEMGASINTLAVSDKTEKDFFLNGNYTEAEDGIVKIGKVDGYYSHPEPGKELLLINGPLDDDIILFVVFYKEENVGYQYKYAEMSPDLSYTPHYQWELLDWNVCSVKCGGGFQMPKYQCVEDKAGLVSDNFCNNMKRPEDEPKKCNEQPCKAKWKVGKWSKCFACKHKSGVKMREVECVRESPRRGAEDILVEDEKCGGPKPGTRQLCNSNYKCESKRSIDNLPDDLREEIWMQTNRKTINRRDTASLKKIEKMINERNILVLQDECRPKTTQFNALALEAAHTMTTMAKKHLDVGKIVVDRIPNEEIKVIKVPLRPSHLSNNLSDSVFETMGDAVGDSIDTGKAVESKGDKAVEILNELAHGRNAT